MSTKPRLHPQDYISQGVVAQACWLYSEFEAILGSMRSSLEKVLVADTTCVKTWGREEESNSKVSYRTHLRNSVMVTFSICPFGYGQMATSVTLLM